jgi:hypothetical protein
VPAVDLTNTGINLHSGDLFDGRIDYDGSTLTLRIDDDNTGMMSGPGFVDWMDLSGGVAIGFRFVNTHVKIS